LEKDVFGLFKNCNKVDKSRTTDKVDETVEFLNNNLYVNRDAGEKPSVDGSKKSLASVVHTAKDYVPLKNTPSGIHDVTAFQNCDCLPADSAFTSHCCMHENHMSAAHDCLCYLPYKNRSIPSHSFYKNTKSKPKYSAPPGKSQLRHVIIHCWYCGKTGHKKHKCIYFNSSRVQFNFRSVKSKLQGHRNFRQGGSRVHQSSLFHKPNPTNGFRVNNKPVFRKTFHKRTFYQKPHHRNSKGISNKFSNSVNSKISQTFNFLTSNLRKYWNPLPNYASNNSTNSTNWWGFRKPLQIWVRKASSIDVSDSKSLDSSSVTQTSSPNLNT